MENSRITSVLNDLLHITNDRIAGFEMVEGKVWEMYSHLKPEYDLMISRTKIMKNELINLINENGGTPSDSASAAGALHRAWIDIRNAFPGSAEKATLDHVLFGEKSAIDAYQSAVDSGDLSGESLEIVSQHLYDIKFYYNNFKKTEDYKDEF